MELQSKKLLEKIYLNLEDSHFVHGGLDTAQAVVKIFPKSSQLREIVEPYLCDLEVLTEKWDNADAHGWNTCKIDLEIEDCENDLLYEIVKYFDDHMMVAFDKKIEISKSDEFEFYKGIILNSVISDLEGNDLTSACPDTRLKYVKNRIASELNYEIEKHGLATACTDFFQGLGTAIPYADFEIVNLGTEFGFDLGSEDKKFDFLDCYFQKLGQTMADLWENI